MPSYRAVLDIGDLRPGRQPEEVMETALAVVGSHHLVEDHRIDIRGGVPVITVRFMVPATSDDEERASGWRCLDDTAQAVGEVAQVRAARITQRTPRGRWLVVARPAEA